MKRFFDLIQTLKFFHRTSLQKITKINWIFDDVKKIMEKSMLYKQIIFTKHITIPFVVWKGIVPFIYFILSHVIGSSWHPLIGRVNLFNNVPKV